MNELRGKMSASQEFKIQTSASNNRKAKVEADLWIDSVYILQMISGLCIASVYKVQMISGFMY